MENKKSFRSLCLENDAPEVQAGMGLNIIPIPEKEPLWKGFLEKFTDPLIIVLLVVFVLSVCVSCYEVFYNGALYSTFIEPIGVLIALLLATGVGFWFEVKAAKEFDVLNQEKDKRKVKVMRRVEGRCQFLLVYKKDVVLGDIVKLESGDEIPADGTLLYANNLRVDESNFTGEMYANKNVEGDSFGMEAAYPANVLLRSTIVIEGSAVMQVTAIGSQTEEGRGALLIREESEVKTPLNQQLDQLGKYISYASFVIAALIVVGRVAFYFLSTETGEFSWMAFAEMLLNSIMIAVALIVVAVPEGLPMSVTVSLALSMRKMLKMKNLVRKLHACETMGAATVICTDKTGTLTENKMEVVACFPAEGVDMPLLARGIAVNSTASLAAVDGVSQIVGNPTEGALLRWIQKLGFDYEGIREAFPESSVVPFSSEIKRMETTSDGQRFIKGAPEVVLEMSDAFAGDFSKEDVAAAVAEYQAKGMRTLGLAYQIGEGPVTFQAVVAIADPVRSDVPDAIDVCRNHAGVRVIMVTGDNAITAREIAMQVGLGSEGYELVSITGPEFAELSDDAAKELIAHPSFAILSRARPADKQRLVSLLQDLGEVVAVTGDGTNDAPALKKAQVGLSMGDGTARAKEASDITIIDNSFASINVAILWGRSLYQNIRRFILFQMTINVAACLIVLYGAFRGLESPLNVTQMLWVNLIMDTFAAMALSSLPADSRVMDMKPRNPQSHIIDRHMMLTITTVGMIFFVLLVGFWQMLSHGNYVDVTEMLHDTTIQKLLDFSQATYDHNSHECGFFFTFFVLLQFWNLFNARYYNTGRSLVQDMWAIVTGKEHWTKFYSTGFLLIVAIIIVGQYLITNVFGAMFGIEALDAEEWGLLLLMTSPVLIVGELLRVLFRKR